MPKMTYKSRVDHDVLPRPEPLPLAAANEWAVDPAYGNRVLRVTDPAWHARSTWTYSASAAHLWSLDSRHFIYLMQGGSTWLGSFDPQRFLMNEPRKLTISNCCFSFEAADVLYGVRQHVVYSLNVQSQILTPLLDLRHATGAAINHEGRVSHSAGWIAIPCGTGIQDSDQYMVCMRLSNGNITVLNTMNSTLNGVSLDGELGWHIHDAAMAKGDPKYVILTPAAGDHTAYQTYVWSHKDDDIYPITTRDMGHAANGFGRRLNPSFQRGIKSMYARSLARADIDQPVFQVETSNELLEIHFGWTNCVGWGDTPVFASGACVIDGPWGYLSGEVFMVSTKPADQTIWRMCSSRSLWNGSLGGANFYDTPRGNISQCGGYAIFSSNWLRSLGPGTRGPRGERAGEFRSDVFLVELR